jgi:hypothetical protein
MTVRQLIALAAAGILAGCSSTSCGADHDKLARLKPGMSREDANALMGCPGIQVSESGASPGRFTTVEWNGPDSLQLSRIYVVFLDGSLYTYSTQRRGGY